MNIFKVAKSILSNNYGFLGKVFKGVGLGDVLGIAGDGVGDYLNYKAVKATNEMNYKIFKETLDYNKPVNQMKRFQEAGLNPSLMYSQGNAGNATAMPTMKAPQLNLDLTQKLGTIYAIKNMKEQNKNLEAQRAMLGIDMNNAVIDGENKILDGLLKSSQNKLLNSQASAQEQNAKKLELENEFFKTHGYWPSQEGSFFRGSRSLLHNIGPGYFKGVETIGGIWDAFIEGLRRENTRLQSRRRLK